MSESFKYKRVKFDKKGVQKMFIEKVIEHSGLNNIQLSEKLGISTRTVSDWKREKFTIPYNTVKQISKIAKIPIPASYTITDTKERLRKSGRKGGKNRIKIYGKVALNEEYRKTKWKEW